jgi:pyruvate dehydrogenase E2 component (dihydrolipoamide acetyltransferase)
MAEIVMPRLSDTMEEGTILRWLKQNGEEVARGEELVEIETDKATMTYESDQQGVLAIVAAEGSTLAVGEVIARIGRDGDAGEAHAAPALAAHAAPEAAAAAPAAPAAAAEAPAAEEERREAPAVTGAEDGGERVKASPLARRIATESGIDLHGVSGSGPGGRIVKADVVRPAGAPSATAAAAVDGVATAKGQTTDVELSRTQQTVARRMAESKATIPDFALLVDVDMAACVELRAQLKSLAHPDNAEGQAAAGGRERMKTPTYNDMVVKACALALREYPSANGSYRDGRLQLHSRVNVGVAVAAEGALVVPTVFDADEKSLGEIARETHTLAERVRSAAITPPELGGGTFTVSNLGMYGVKSFTAIINPPQAAILSVGAVERRAVASEDVVLARHTMTLTLVCDHRILYGAEAAQFLARVRELLQTPSALTL